MRTLTTDRGDEKRRLDLVIRRHLAGAEAPTRARVQRWIARGSVTLNGATVRRAATRTRAGDVVSVTIDDAVLRRTPQAEAIALDVLYEDAILLAIDKPPGVVVHPGYRQGTGTVLNALLWHARRWPASERPSIVGRLDKLTSGLVIVAKTASAHAALQRAMASPDAEKDYLAVVYGRVKPVRTRIDLRLRRDPADRRRVVASRAIGAESLTKVERVAGVAARRAGLALLCCRLGTGRMHQIRVHLAARGWPIVGDPVYGEPRWRDVLDPVLAKALGEFPRQALHAWRVAFTHPITGATVRLEAPVPDDLEGLLTAAGLAIPALTPVLKSCEVALYEVPPLP
jgi:23S rRNA pseudouridine1911/1915/1917 synthase